MNLSHKAKGANDDYLSYDSASHITMVKRMVALTATMQSCLRGVFSGLPDQSNFMTIENSVDEMFAFSGNASSGKGFRTELENADGAMYTLGYVSKLTKQSMADTKPKGSDLKLLVHNLDPEKGAAYLIKMASFDIDNAFLRSFSMSGMKDVGATDMRGLVKLSLGNSKIRPVSINEKGKIIDYSGLEIELDPYFKKDGILYKASNVTVDPTTNIIHYDLIDVIQNKLDKSLGVTNKECNNDLYSLWENVLGGEFSCDRQGNYGEQSQDAIAELLNSLGTLKPNKNLDEVEEEFHVLTQKDVDQYAKKEIVHFFPTSSVQKSLQAPITTIEKALSDLKYQFTVKIDIDNLGVQLDADHVAEGGEIHEITQLMSNTAENNYVPEITTNIYNTLQNLAESLSEKVSININAIKDPFLRKEAQRKLDNVFEKRLCRVFIDPSLNVIGLANEIAQDIQNIPELKLPKSDLQILAKANSTIGSYMNEFIARSWRGRADVLMPSHNIAMLYEDSEGNIFMNGDKKYIKTEDGWVETNAVKWLKDQVWDIKEDGTKEFKESYLNNTNYRVKAWELQLTDVYYDIDTRLPVVINNWDTFNKVRDNILNGKSYIRAIDLPRNLRVMQVFLNFDNFRIN